MKKEKDHRITVKYASIKEYFLLFGLLAALNGFHMWLYQDFLIRGLFETNIRFAINFLIGYMALAAAGITGLTAYIRHTSWNRPMRKLSEAAHKVAQGDFAIRISPLRKDGKKDYVEVMFDDFNTMAQELQSIEIMKNDFIANVSHEIKTPLAVIQSYATSLQNNTLTDDERSEYIKTIVETIHKFSALVSNILKLNKLENQNIPHTACPYELSEQIRRCAVSFEELWEHKNITFEAEMEEVIVCYDENMLDIVWNNLISNAIKFSNPEGRIKIKLSIRDDYANENLAQVSISDNGCGMDKETQKRIFDKFYQGDTSHSQEGNGLGLALVKRTVDLLGGTIDVKSKPGHGSTFTVCLKI
jgi:signal transduction histidine kinase